MAPASIAPDAARKGRGSPPRAANASRSNGASCSNARCVILKSILRANPSNPSSPLDEGVMPREDGAIGGTTRKSGASYGVCCVTSATSQESDWSGSSPEKRLTLAPSAGNLLIPTARPPNASRNKSGEPGSGVTTAAGMARGTTPLLSTLPA